MNAIYKNPVTAGAVLASALSRYANREDVVIVGLNNEGLPVAIRVALQLKLTLDFILARKLVVSDGTVNRVLGAVTSEGVGHIIQSIDAEDALLNTAVNEMAKLEIDELVRRDNRYQKMCPHQIHRKKTVILVTEGIAAASLILAAVCSIKKKVPNKIVVATPIASKADLAVVCSEVDDVVCLNSPYRLVGVGQCYRTNGLVCEKEVKFWLEKLWHNQVATKGVVGASA